MYRPRPAKSQQSDKTPYTAYNPHTIEIPDDRWSNYDYYRVISVDPGTKNFAIRVEKRPKAGKYFPITTELFNRIKLTDGVNEAMLCSVYDVLTQFLDQHMDLFMNSHIIIIERQLSVNYRTVRISQHVLTYFMIRLRNVPSLPLIFEVDPKLKGKQLGAPTGINERQLKEWSVKKATDLFTMRNDKIGLEALKKSKKKADDLADTVCQIEALFCYLGWPLTQAPQIIKITPPSSVSLSELVNKVTEQPNDTTSNSKGKSSGNSNGESLSEFLQQSLPKSLIQSLPHRTSSSQPLSQPLPQSLPQPLPQSLPQPLSQSLSQPLSQSLSQPLPKAGIQSLTLKLKTRDDYRL